MTDQEIHNILFGEHPGSAPLTESLELYRAVRVIFENEQFWAYQVKDMDALPRVIVDALDSSEALGLAANSDFAHRGSWKVGGWDVTFGRHYVIGTWMHMTYDAEGENDHGRLFASVGSREMTDEAVDLYFSYLLKPVISG